MTDFSKIVAGEPPFITHDDEIRAPLEDEIETLRRSLAAAKQVIKAKEAVQVIQDEKLKALDEAVNTLASERAANALLTNEIDTLRQRVKELEISLISLGGISASWANKAKRHETELTALKAGHGEPVAWLNDANPMFRFTKKTEESDYPVFTAPTIPECTAVEASAMSHHSRAMLLNIIWHHQGANSTVGQPLRRMLGIEQFARLTDDQVSEAKWIECLLSATKHDTSTTTKEERQ